ncbi:hypothetical protein [Francisella tularensis]
MTRQQVTSGSKTIHVRTDPTA